MRATLARYLGREMVRGGNPKLTPGEFVIMLAGVLGLIFSFLPWYSVDGGADVTAWAPGLFPFAALAPLAGIVMAIQVALDRVARVSMPRRVSDFTWEQIHMVLGIFALLMVLGYIIVEKVLVSFDLGFYLVFLTSAGLVVGAVLLRQERRLSSRPGPLS